MTPALETKKFILNKICNGDEKEYESKFGWMSPIEAEYAITRWMAETRGYSHPIFMFIDMHNQEVN